MRHLAFFGNNRQSPNDNLWIIPPSLSKDVITVHESLLATSLQEQGSYCKLEIWMLRTHPIIQSLLHVHLSKSLWLVFISFPFFFSICDFNCTFSSISYPLSILLFVAGNKQVGCSFHFLSFFFRKGPCNPGLFTSVGPFFFLLDKIQMD